MVPRSLILSLLALLAACKGATGGKLPVDHPTYQYQPPPEAEAEEPDTEEAED